MSVPDFQSLMLPALKALADGVETLLSEVRTRIAAVEELTPEDVREMLPRGRWPVFTNRVSWPVLYLVYVVKAFGTERARVYREYRAHLGSFKQPCVDNPAVVAR